MYAFASLRARHIGRKKNRQVFQSLTVVTGGIAPGLKTTNQKQTGIWWYDWARNNLTVDFGSCKIWVMKNLTMTAAVMHLYNLLWKAALPFLGKNARLKQGLSQRLSGGHLEKADIWIHAASAGESYIAARILSHIFPPSKTRVLLTSVTAQGMEILEKTVSDAALDSRLSCRVAWFPFDMPAVMEKAVSTVRPRVMVLLETEIWPALLYYLKQSGTDIAIINGRLSNKSYRAYVKTRAFWNRIAPDRILATSVKDAQRYRLIFQNAAVGTMDNIKFDAIAFCEPAAETPLPLLRVIDTRTPFSVLASVRKEEEPYVEKLIEKLFDDFPGQVIALFPRHMHRLDHWEKHLTAMGIDFRRKSHMDRTAPPGTVILWDVFGELKQTYELAVTAFVGGSLAPLGGQNFIEPAMAGVATVTGPYVENFKWAGKEIFQQNIVHRADTWEAAAAFMVDSLKHPPDRAVLKKKGLSYIRRRQGGSKQAAQEILSRLDH